MPSLSLNSLQSLTIMLKRLLCWIIFTCLLCDTSAQHQLLGVEYNLSESTWHFLRNRNRHSATLSRGHALLLDTPPSFPSNALLPPRKMLLLLGPRFLNPSLLSVSEPQASILNPHGQMVFPKVKREQSNEVRKRADILKQYLKGISLRQIERLAGVFTTCPIIYKWHDYGEYYWPRWVREGQCVNPGGTSCSLPPGMFCTGHEETAVVLLRYVCPFRGDEAGCSWYRMQKPVLLSCKCACR